MRDLIKIFYFIFIITLNYSLNAQQFINDSEIKLITNNSYSKLYKQYAKNTQDKDTISSIKNLLLLSKKNRSNLNYGKAFNYSGEALFLSEQLKDTILMSKSHLEYGILNYLFKQDKLAGLNFQKSLDYLKSINQPDKKLYKSYYYLILYHLRIRNIDKANELITKCDEIISKNKLNNINKAYLYEKKAIAFKLQNKINKAIDLVTKSISIIKNYENNQSFLILLYGNIADLYSKKNEKKLAIEYYKKAIDTKDTYGENTFYKAYLFTKYASLLYEINKTKEAYIYLQKAKKINDTYLNPRNEDTQSFLTLKDQYNEQLVKYSKKIDAQQLEISVVKNRITKLKYYFTAFILLIILISLLIWIKRKSKKHELEQLASENRIAENNKELTKNILQLIEKEEIINTLKSHIKKNNNDSHSKSLLKSIDNRSNKLWDLFNNSFMSQNKGFYERLQKKVPDLSSSDLKVCALIKLNFSGKEMAYLLGISLGSVHVARHRLRKKISLDRSTNLTNFISSI